MLRVYSAEYNVEYPVQCRETVNVVQCTVYSVQCTVYWASWLFRWSFDICLNKISSVRRPNCTNSTGTQSRSRSTYLPIARNLYHHSSREFQVDFLRQDIEKQENKLHTIKPINFPLDNYHFLPPHWVWKLSPCPLSTDHQTPNTDHCHHYLGWSSQTTPAHCPVLNVHCTLFQTLH